MISMQEMAVALCKPECDLFPRPVAGLIMWMLGEYRKDDRRADSDALARSVCEHGQSQGWACTTGADGFLEPVKVPGSDNRIRVHRPLDGACWRVTWNGRFVVSTPNLRLAAEDMIHVVATVGTATVEYLDEDSLIERMRRAQRG